MTTPSADDVAGADRQAGDVLVLFGITGDLAKKKILPALYELDRRGELDVPVVGVALTDWDADQLRKHVDDCVRAECGGTVDDTVLERLKGRVQLVAGDYGDAATFERLADKIRELARKKGDTAGSPTFAVHYLAVPPSLFGVVADGLAGVGLNEHGRLVVEKPFGHDLDSARALNAQLSRDFPEDRIFRVDHYLGKESVEGLLVLRFANTLLEPLWNRTWIDHLEVTMAEDFDVADRGKFYDAVGTVRDVVQNHLLQVLAYLLMEAPLSDGANDQRNAKHRLLRAVRAADPAHAVRGQYDGYLATPGVAPDSTTETFVALTLYVDDWRWAGIPMYLRAGKALPTTMLDVVVVLRPPPRPLFGESQANRIRVRLQPDAGITFSLLGKRHGAGDDVVDLPVTVDFEQVMGPADTAYERILADALVGDPTHFARMDNLEQAWRIVGPLLDLQSQPLPYAQGSWGPVAATTLPDGRGWSSPRG